MNKVLPFTTKFEREKKIRREGVQNSQAIFSKESQIKMEMTRNEIMLQKNINK